MKKTISFILNGNSVRVDAEPQDVLLDVLRNGLGLKSPKCGCDRGDCGTCTVMINGRTMRSCLVLALEVDGQSVTTLEGLMKDGEMTPLQQSFVKNNSFQCGFCAPGMILSATELLERNPAPGEEEIKEALSGNLCRCTGYLPIIDAIAEVSALPAATAKHGKGAKK
jgi:aerobic-type carbon monoxide dehydrogenase small subunit (CoxS/CutS family)